MVIQSYSHIVILFYSSVVLQSNFMSTTVPKQRDYKKFKDSRDKINQLQKIYSSKNKFTFQQYCKYSIQYLQAPDQKFYAEKDKIDLKLLINPTIDYSINRVGTKNMAEVIQTGKRIIKIITYSWQNIQKYIEGKAKKKAKNEEDIMQIYSQQNINLHFARLEQMLKDLQSKRYRWQNYSKSNSFNRQIQQKQIKQQMTFIKLLQTIIDTQSKKIEQNRKNPKSSQKQDNKQDDQEQQNIGLIVKAEQYFKRKYSQVQKQVELIENPFKQIQDRRRFNVGALRYHYANYKKDL